MQGNRERSHLFPATISKRTPKHIKCDGAAADQRKAHLLQAIVPGWGIGCLRIQRREPGLVAAVDPTYVGISRFCLTHDF